MRTPRPTNASPGSEAKMRVISQRYFRGEALWHDDDNRLCEEQPRRQQGRHEPRRDKAAEFGDGIFVDEESGE